MSLWTMTQAVEAHGIYDKLTDEALYTGAGLGRLRQSAPRMMPARGVTQKVTHPIPFPPSVYPPGAHRHRFGLESEGAESPRARRVSDRPSAPPPPDYRTGELEGVFDVSVR